jgi:hypothetical protein
MRWLSTTPASARATQTIKVPTANLSNGSDCPTTLSRFPIETGSVELACDGLAAISCYMSLDQPTSCKSRHFEFISAIRQLMRACLIQGHTRHVLGHQLTRQAKLTCNNTPAPTPTKLFGPLD